MFRCKHEPDNQLQGETKIVDRAKFLFHMTCTVRYRELVTTHVCKKCRVYYVTIHEIDEASAMIGPPKKPSPEKGPND